MTADELNNLLQALLQGKRRDPYVLLGPHGDETGMTWRVLLPQAQTVYIEGRKSRRYKMRQCGSTPIFEWQGASKKLKRRPQIFWLDQAGQSHAQQDPYQFPVVLPEKRLARFSNGDAIDAYRILGAHVRKQGGVSGVRFAVWAPHASRVSVVGDFNCWDGITHTMCCDDQSGIWTLFVPGLGNGVLYKFEVLSQQGLQLKADPYAFRSEHRPHTASITAPLNQYQWHDDDWLDERRDRDWLHDAQTIYEVHLDSWQAFPAECGESEAGLSCYQSIAHALVDYARSMHFTHIELMPMAEHPLDDSWGYQTTGYFAPTSRFGTPDDLRYLIDLAHQNGVGVLLDWTPAHFPKDAHGLALFDGTHLYEHTDALQREHPDWNTLVFDYSRNEVRSFLLSNAAYWLQEFHFDGLRVDAVASMLYLDYSRAAGRWTPNEFGGNENLGAMKFLRDLNIRLHEKFPGTVIIAEESTAWPMVSRPVYLGGLGFSMKWNLGWMHDSLQYFSQDPVHRRYHHDRLTFALDYAFNENFVLPLSHDEVVHTKRSMLHKMPGDRWQQFANLRLLYCFQYTMPGKKLLFMGDEFAVETEWDFHSKLNWRLLERPEHKGVQRLVRDLNHLVVSRSALSERDFESSGFAWLDRDDTQHSLLAYQRISSKQHLLCLLNFLPEPRRDFRLGVARAGQYHEVLNSDSRFYGGSDVGNAGMVQTEDVPYMGQPVSMIVTLPPLACIILEPVVEV